MIYCDKQERYNLAREISELENRKNENRQIISAQEDKIMESDEIISAKNREIIYQDPQKGFLVGVRNWKEFDVYFPEELLNALGQEGYYSSQP